MIPHRAGSSIQEGLLPAGKTTRFTGIARLFKAPSRRPKNVRRQARKAVSRRRPVAIWARNSQYHSVCKTDDKVRKPVVIRAAIWPSNVRWLCDGSIGSLCRRCRNLVRLKTRRATGEPPGREDSFDVAVHAVSGVNLEVVGLAEIDCLEVMIGRAPPLSRSGLPVVLDAANCRRMRSSAS